MYFFSFLLRYSQAVIERSIHDNYMKYKTERRNIFTILYIHVFDPRRSGGHITNSVIGETNRKS